MPGNLYWDHNDFYYHGHASTNQIKATSNQVLLSSLENFPVDVTADTEFSPSRLYLCLFTKFDHLPFTVYSLYEVVVQSKLSRNTEHLRLQCLFL